jgi:hypothetical protein
MINFAHRLQSKLDKCITNSNGCIIWPGPFGGRGYGQYNIGYNKFLAHVIVYNMTIGVVPPGLELHHRCRNNSCVNVLHLELVTHKDNLIAARNMNDLGQAKLSMSIAKQIRDEYNKGDTTHRLLAKKYKVDKSSIQRLLARKAWSDEHTDTE